MKRISKSVFIVLLAVMFIAAFAGCDTTDTNTEASDQTNDGEDVSTSEDTTTDGNAEESVPPAEPVTLTLWNSTVEGVDNGYKAIIDAYTAEHPNVTIEFSSFPGEDYESKLKTALTGGTGPDIYFTTGWNNLQTYVDAGYAENLDGKIDVSAFSQDALDVGRINGSLYAGPGAKADYLTVFYNKDLFAQAGVEAPSSYDEFVNVCGQLKASGINPIAMGGQESVPYLFAWLITGQALESSYFEDIRSGAADTFTDERMLGIIDTLAEWANAEYYQDGFEGTTYAAMKILFSTEQAAMIFTGTWDYAEFTVQNAEMNVGAFAFPGYEKTYGIRAAGSGLTVNSASENKDVAIDFVNFTCSSEAVALMVAATNGIPIIDGIEIADPVMEEVATAPEYAGFYNIPMNIAGINSTNPQEVFMNNILAVIDGSMTSMELAEKMDDAWDPAAYAAIFE